MLVPMPRPRPSPRSSRGGKGQGPVLPSEARTGGLEAEEGELRAKFAIKDAAMLFSCRKRRARLVEAKGICFEPGKAVEESVGHWMEDARGVGDHRREAVVLAFKPLVVLGNLEVEDTIESRGVRDVAIGGSVHGVHRDEVQHQTLCSWAIGGV